MYTHIHTHARMHVYTQVHMHAHTQVGIHTLSCILKTHKINVCLFPIMTFSGASEHNFLPVRWQYCPVSLFPSPLFLLCVQILMHIYQQLVYSLFQRIYVNMQ